ncbi:GNAT family N-acetyltransferase [Pyxidicoccus fallax]|uniref:GNAT family N-acetyltransferase n=1 Tax=Pyxidicoccus fallax TaxID=394095 RepID=A0A848LP04_9BACT|nr:N-acetyltransferase [Pyxidicoccus fallax]NMO19421.1 GNAT family N-acetyltransferase [Pyxidicoccus fallax]NPC86161.1 GNAT family N-acetyltransferase [Pyxidicoccus fallax]
MTVTFQELDRGLLDQVGPMCARAFDDYPFLAELFPGESSRRAKVSSRFYSATVIDCLEHGTVHAAVDDGKLAGVAAWLRPGAFPQSLGRQARFLPTVWAGLRHYPSRARLALQALARLERSHPHSPPHWYLATIAVDPAYQGKGLGVRLMKQGLALAAEKGDPCFLETAKGSNRDWYLGFGFQVQLEEPCFDGGPPQWFMWRPPEVLADEPAARTPGAAG